jgi:hypothetical protein
MTPIHLMAYLSDRYLTGDDIVFSPREELLSLLEDAFGASKVKEVEHVPPRRSNASFVAHL